jgi:D-alanine-D-alanine ligase
MTARVAVLFGGPSVEHEVSIVSARGVLENMDRERFHPLPVYQDREGVWHGPAAAEKVLKGKPVSADGNGLGGILRTLKAEAAFPLIHGTFGEDGTLQGHLEALGVPYAGCGVRASAVGMDKEYCKVLWAARGLPVVPWVTLHREGWRESVRDVRERLPLPVFVKPADSGSSVGITKVKHWNELPAAVEAAFGVSRKVIVERGIAGREIEVSVLGGYEAGTVSPPGEIVPGREFYDYDDKYADGSAAGLRVPAPLPEALAERFRELAREAFAAIDGYGMARVDFFLEGEETLFLNEINTIPGFTPISMYPKLLGLCGLSYAQVITRLLELGMERGTVSPHQATGNRPQATGSR